MKLWMRTERNLMSDFKGRRFQCCILLDRRAADRRPADITSEC